MNPNDWNQANNPSLPNTPQNQNDTPNEWQDSDKVTGVPYPEPAPSLDLLDQSQSQPQTTIPNTDDGFSDMVPRDPNVLNFMAAAVLEKNGQDVDQTFLKQEAERLYDEFGEKLVDYFEPMLTKEQIEQFDNLMNQGSTQDQLLAFLMSCIPDLTTQIEKVLIEYKEKYIYGF